MKLVQNRNFSSEEPKLSIQGHNTHTDEPHWDNDSIRKMPVASRLLISIPKSFKLYMYILWIKKSMSISLRKDSGAGCLNRKETRKERRKSELERRVQESGRNLAWKYAKRSIKWERKRVRKKERGDRWRVEGLIEARSGVRK